MRKPPPQQYSAHIHVNGRQLPVTIVLEARRGHRFSITRQRITMRLPLHLQREAIDGFLKQLENWVQGVALKKTNILEPFQVKNYQTGDILRVGDRAYRLEISYADQLRQSARMVGSTIALTIYSKATDASRAKSVKTLLSRIVAKDFQAEIHRRVHDINNRTFRQTFKNITLKYNHSNWGSCSRQGNVNISTRLLFAPTDVQDYVILHELAHLVELNHSDRFWALVAQHMPDYKEKERWLRLHGPECDF